jgi:predicted enzyme related to lactoylglutathione lyase
MRQVVVHFEVIARDGPAMRAFYSSLFDWRIDTDNSWGT